MTAESELIARAAAGDGAALGTLAERHRPPVRRIAYHILGDVDMAEDVAQDVFVRLQASLPGFRSEAELSTWLYRVTVNLCRDHLRRRSRRAPHVTLSALAGSAAPRVESHADAELDAERARAAVRNALDRLPEDQREAVTLRYIADLSYAEIARVTGCPEGTVASRIFRALERLGREIEPRHMEVVQ